MSLLDLSAELQAAIGGASNMYGVPANTLGALATIESGGNVNANNGTAYGPFQFTNSTASALGVMDPFDLNQASAGAAQYWNQISQSLSSALGSAPADWQTYIGYQQGVSGATALFNGYNQDPNQSAALALANGTGMSLSQAISRIGNNLPQGFNNGNPGGASVGDFLAYYQNQWGKAGGAVTTPIGGGSSGTASSGTGSSSAGVTGWLSHWFVRIFVFLLGLVFTAAGLFMLSRTGKLTIANAQQNTANSIIAPPVQRYKITEQPSAPEAKTPKIKAMIKTARRREKPNPIYAEAAKGDQKALGSFANVDYRMRGGKEAIAGAKA